MSFLLSVCGPDERRCTVISRANTLVLLSTNSGKLSKIYKQGSVELFFRPVLSGKLHALQVAAPSRFSTLLAMAVFTTLVAIGTQLFITSSWFRWYVPSYAFESLQCTDLVRAFTFLFLTVFCGVISNQ